jgi:hypothetical protein
MKVLQDSFIVATFATITTFKKKFVFSLMTHLLLIIIHMRISIKSGFIGISARPS